MRQGKEETVMRATSREGSHYFIYWCAPKEGGERRADSLTVSKCVRKSLRSVGRGGIRGQIVDPELVVVFLKIVNWERWMHVERMMKS